MLKKQDMSKRDQIGFYSLDDLVNDYLEQLKNFMVFAIRI